MAENKFIERLQGKGTEKSVVEIKNTATPTMFTNMPSGDSNAFNTYSDHRGNATVVANGTMNWKVSDAQTLSLASTVHGNGEDITGSESVSGAGLWIDAEYTFPNTGDPNHPVAMVFNPQTKWVLKLCGDNLLSPTSDTIEFTVLITFGVSNIISKTFTVAKQANKFCKEFVIDFAESNTNIIKAQGLSTMKLQLLCGTADASANIYGGMTVLTCLQRKVEAVAISSTFANVEEVLRDGMLPTDYFNNAAYIAQVTDGDTAFAVFQRDGDEMLFVGWHQPIPDQTGNSGKFLTTDGSLMSWAQLTISDVDNLQTELSDLQDQIDDLSGRGRFLSVWNCATGLAETNPPTSPYTYKAGDYFIVGVVSTATPAVNYKPTGSSYTTGVPSTVVETAEVNVDDTYIYDGTTWKLQANSQRTYTFAGIAGSPYDNTALGNALNGKVDETSTANQVYGTDNAGNQTTYTITQYLKNTATATDAISVYGTANTTWTNGINIGAGSRITSNNGIAIGVDASADVNAVAYGRDADAGVRGTAIGAYAKTSADTGIAIGCWNSVMHNAVSSAKGAYQFGVGTNNTARTLNVGWYNDSVTPSTFVNYQLLDGDTGLIPDARISTNITRNADLATVATTGDYTDLLNKPTIPAAQVNSDWNAISGVAQILNKPTIPTVNDATISVTQNGVSVGSFTLNQASGDTIALTDTTYSVMTGASAGDAGANGLVPAPAAGDQGKFLQGDGTWATVDALPAQTGHSGEYLTTDGSTASWATVNTLPSQTGQSGKFLTTDGTNASWAAVSVTPDNSTITKNASDELQAVATVNANTAAGATNPVYDWVGTLAEYNAQDIENQHPDWMCYITDDVNGGTSVYTKSEVDTIANGKANIALDNITSAGKAVCANMAMPSDSYINLTLGGSGTNYTAPADGWFFLHKAGNGSGQFLTVINRGQINFDKFQFIGYDITGGAQLTCFMPVKKGDIVHIGYSIGGQTYSFRFIYAQGEA